MNEPRIRAATAADVPAIAEIVDQAYRHYIARMGKPPGPMLDDYVARVSEGAVWVLEAGAVIAAIMVLLPAPNYLLLDNIAVSPAHQRLGLGRRLLAFAEDEALRRGYREIRLYTHQTMVENQRLYTSIGYEETGRGSEAGYNRVFMRKRLDGVPPFPEHGKRRPPGLGKSYPVMPLETDPIKRQVAAHWDRRAAHFDEDFGHSIRTPAERGAWDRVLDLILPSGLLDALDIGCGTGFLSLELEDRGHRVTGVDFAPSMIAQARKKAAERQATIRFEEADAEQLPFPSASFDIAVSRHLLWTLPHPERAMDEWVRVLRPGGRLIIIDSQADVSASPEPLDNARRSPEYAAIGDRLPFVSGWPCEEIETLFAAHRLSNIASDPFLDLVAAEERRMKKEGLERRIRRRYAVWGDVPR